MDLATYIERAGRGAQTRLAVAVGCLPQMVNHWAKGARPVPAARCAAIERATSGAVTVAELDPTTCWVRVPDPTWPHPDGRPCIDVAGPGTADEEVRRAA